MRLRQKVFACVFLVLLLVLSVIIMGVSADPEILLSVEPSEQVVSAALPFTINITVTNVADLWACEFKLWYNSTVLTALDVTPGPIWRTDYYEAVEDLTVPGRVWYGITFIRGESFTGTGTLATVTFNATAVGESFLHLNETIMGNNKIINWIPHTTVDGTVEVRHARSLTILSLPPGVQFRVDGVYVTTPWSGTYGEDVSVSLEMPYTYSVYTWSHWLEDGTPHRTKTVTMDTNITLTGVYSSIYKAVGGKATPIVRTVNKPELLAPYIGLTVLLAVAIVVVYFKKRKRYTEIEA